MLKVEDKKYYLRRLNPKLGETIAWEILSEDKKYRYGIVARYNSQWLIRKFGWKEYKVNFWLVHVFWKPRVVSGSTMKKAIMNAFSIIN